VGLAARDGANGVGAIDGLCPRAPVNRPHAEEIDGP